MKQKINTLLASLALLLCSITMSAQTFGVDGITYTVYNENEVYVSSGSQYEGDLIIPESVAYSGNDYKVTSIWKSAFFFCDGLTSVIIPNSVKIIREDAFCGCSGLTSVTIGNSVIEIKQGAFSGCRKLKTVINFSVLFFKRGEGWPHGGIAFYAKNVVNARNGSLVGDYVFDGYNALCGYVGDETDLTLPENHNGENYAIGSNAFSGCSALTSVVIPSSVTSIGSNAFSGCSALTSVVIPSSVTSIGSNAFSGCSSLPVENDIRYADCYLVEVTDVSLQTYTIKAGTRFIGSSAFSGCSSLLSVTIPNSVTSIGYEAFGYCSALTSVTIGSGVKSIGDYAFDGCSGLTSVTIPNSVTSIGNAAFSGCSGLTSVTIGNSVTSLGEMAFYGCSGLTSVTIGSGVTSIGDYAFDGCSGLTSVTIPNSVTSIGNAAFSGCSGLTSVTIGNSVTSIGDQTFYGCSGLTSVTIPNSVTSIGDYAFLNCSGLTSVTIPNSVMSIGRSAFSGCSSLPVENGIRYADSYLVDVTDKNLSTYIIQDGTRFIGSFAFSGCSALTSITIPNSVTSIGDDAFKGCQRLKTVVNFSNLNLVKGSTDYGYVAYYASKVINAPNASFEDNYVFSVIDGTNTLCLYLGDETELTLPENFKGENYVIGAGAFSDYTSLTSVTIPNSVTSIGENAFSGCKMIAKITIGNGITSISEYAFADCESLEEVYCLAENVPTTPTNAFRGSYIELATLYVPKVALKRYKVNAPWSGFGEIAEFTQTYTITYILDGVEFKKESWEAGTKIKTPQAPEKEGHTFNGWENVPETMPANDIVIEGSYSVNKYLLTFKIEGEVISSEYVEYGTKIETPQAPEKEGHTFNGWENVPETMPAMDIVLYGSYTVNIYKVYYYVGEELVHTDEVAYGESIPAYEYIPTNGDKFMGWDGEKYDTMPAHDVTYTANIVSGILYINGDMSDYTIYDLNGWRIENINNLKNGVYIVNGKMTIVKVN